MSDTTDWIVIGAMAAFFGGMGLWLIIQGLLLRRQSKREQAYAGRGEAFIVRIESKEENDDTFYYPIYELTVNGHRYEQAFSGINRPDHYKLGARQAVDYDVADPSHFCFPGGVMSAVDGGIGIGCGLFLLLMAGFILLNSL